jgi:SAM-dependent methyltransferase
VGGQAQQPGKQPQDVLAHPPAGELEGQQVDADPQRPEAPRTTALCRVAFDAPAVLDFLGVPRDLGGKRALDVGTWDGPLAFEMEERGAEVHAIDVQDPDCTAFNTAKAIRNSRVKYTQLSVYDLEKVFSEKFDLITYFGVYYHLKNPIGAFEALSRSLADGGALCLEGEVLAHYSETLAGTPSDLDNQLLANSDVPLTLCPPGEYTGASNWFVPNLACLRGWLLAAGFDLAFYRLDLAESERPYPRQRILAAVMKASDLPIADLPANIPSLLDPARPLEYSILRFSLNKTGRSRRTSLQGPGHVSTAGMPSTG